MISENTDKKKPMNVFFSYQKPDLTFNIGRDYR